MRRRIALAAPLLLVASIIVGCAPARVELDPAVRARLPQATVVHLVTYPTEPPPIMTAAAIGVGSLFGPLGGAMAGVRAAEFGKEMMAKHNVENLSAQLATKLADDLKAALPNLTRAARTPDGEDVDALKKAELPSHRHHHDEVTR